MTMNARGVEDVSENPKSFINFVRHTVLGTTRTGRKVVHTGHTGDDLNEDYTTASTCAIAIFLRG